MGENLDSGNQEIVGDASARAVSLLNQHVSNDYESIVCWQKELLAAVQKVIMERLEPAFNQKLASMPQDSLTDKQAVCRWANSELRALGYLARCEKTGKPAILHATPGHSPAAGRFQFELVGGARRRTKTAEKLFWVTLMAEPARSESLAEPWLSRQTKRRKSITEHNL